MKALLENIAGLFKVKTIMTLLLVVTLVILALRGEIENEFFIASVSSVVTYYFTRNKNKEE